MWQICGKCGKKMIILSIMSKMGMYQKCLYSGICRHSKGFGSQIYIPSLRIFNALQDLVSPLKTVYTTLKVHQID